MHLKNTPWYEPAFLGNIHQHVADYNPKKDPPPKPAPKKNDSPVQEVVAQEPSTPIDPLAPLLDIQSNMPKRGTKLTRKVKSYFEKSNN